MSYVALYRRWRPTSFADLVGQEHISRTLSRAVTSGQTSHAYLFTGPRGTGKTSTAKILARSLNCAQGPTLTPCGQCESCRRWFMKRRLRIADIEGTPEEDQPLVCPDCHFGIGRHAN